MRIKQNNGCEFPPSVPPQAWPKGELPAGAKTGSCWRAPLPVRPPSSWLCRSLQATTLPCLSCPHHTCSVLPEYLWVGAGGWLCLSLFLLLLSEVILSATCSPFPHLVPEISKALSAKHLTCYVLEQSACGGCTLVEKLKRAPGSAYVFDK